MQTDMRIKAEASAFLTERLGHASAPSWRYDLMRCAPKLVKLIIETPDTPVDELRSEVEAIIRRQCDFAEADPVATQRHVGLVIDALGELHGEVTPRDTTLMRPLVAGR